MLTIVLRIILISLLAVSANGKTASIGDKLVEYTKYSNGLSKDYTSKETAFLINTKYQELFKNELRNTSLKKKNSRDLVFLFRATELVLFYNTTTEYAKDLNKIFNLIKIKNKAEKQQIFSLYNAFISVRMINEAKNLEKNYPLILNKELPEFTNSTHLDLNKISAWIPSLITTALERKNIDLSEGTQILMIAHPLCHFSNNAIHAIQADAQLNNVLFNNMKLLAPQDKQLNFDEIQKWNREHISIPISIVHSESEWPEIDDWSTPSFYFFKDGLLKLKVNGWPKEGNRDNLIQGLKLIDLLPQDELTTSKIKK